MKEWGVGQLAREIIEGDIQGNEVLEACKDVQVSDELVMGKVEDS